jgi:tRNA(Arg) A34 adenosine deaminase TadA
LASDSRQKDDLKYLRETIELAKASRKGGNHPFGAILVGPDDEVLLQSGNTFKKDKGVGHAEANVARAASRLFEAEFLESCTLYTSVEPCCMCAGTCYWAGIGTVVYGMTEKRLAALTGDNPENLTLDLCCQQVFEAGQRKVKTRGPYADLEEEVAEGHRDFW